MGGELVDVETFIQTTAAPGSMVYARFGDHPERAAWRTGFFIREDADRVKWLPANPQIEMRGAMLYEDQIGLVVTLLRIGGELYETWWNYGAEGNRELFDDMANQDKITLVFYTPQRARAITCGNGYKEIFEEALPRLQSASAWTMADFDQARAKVFASYATVADLWRALKKKGRIDERKK